MARAQKKAGGQQIGLELQGGSRTHHGFAIMFGCVFGDAEIQQQRRVVWGSSNQFMVDANGLVKLTGGYKFLGLLRLPGQVGSLRQDWAGEQRDHYDDDRQEGHSTRKRMPAPGASQSISRPKGSSTPEYG